MHLLNCVETPQQNVIVERKHQHILNVARALKFQSHLPLQFWGHCVLTAVYLINIVPSFALSHKKPFEIIFGHLATYSHLRIFCCLCYASTLSHNRSKFAPRAKKCVFLGYPFGVKGYMVLDLSTNTVFVKMDVIFHEDIFPFANAKSDFYDPFVPVSDAYTLPVVAPFKDTFVTPINILDNSDFVSTAPPSKSPYFIIGSDISLSLLPDSSHPLLDIPLSSLPESSPSHPVSPLPIIPSSPLSPPTPTRKSTKSHRAPTYLQDYSCNAAAHTSGSLCDIATSLTYSHLDPDYQFYLMTISSCDQEPEHFFQAMKDLAWREAMDKENTALEKNHTWEVTTLPPGKSPINWLQMGLQNQVES